MKLKEIYAKNNNFPVISFEVFPPTYEYTKLLDEIEILKKYNPGFISLTCGAGGKGSKSIELLQLIQNKKLNVMPHFTCINSSKESIENGIRDIEKLGVENVLALRGDIPEGYSELNKKDFEFACDLVKFIKEKTSLCVGVAGYPEGHIESPDLKNDIKYLKHKIEMGADAIFTQLFFDTDKFLAYKEILEKNKIYIPLIAGIMPIISKKQVEKMTSMARITIPKKIKNKIDKYATDNKSMLEFGITYAAEQCEKLISNDTIGLHFFTLNKAYSTSKILDNIKKGG